jgi:hypothetical protein
MLSWVAVALLAASAPAARVQAQRPNPDECLKANERIDLTQLAASLGDKSVQCSGTEKCTFKANLAKDFSIEYYPDYKVLMNSESSPSVKPYATVLYPCGKAKPAESKFAALKARTSGIGYFATPLYAVATADTTAGWALVHARAWLLHVDAQPAGAVGCIAAV